MTAWFVSRHVGAVEWIQEQGLPVDRVVEHLDIAKVARGDVVLGTLPVNLAGDVCSRGARYFHLTLEVPPRLRGIELDAETMRRCRARIEEFEVRRR